MSLSVDARLADARAKLLQPAFSAIFHRLTFAVAACGWNWHFVATPRYAMSNYEIMIAGYGRTTSVYRKR